MNTRRWGAAALALLAPLLSPGAAAQAGSASGAALFGEHCAECHIGTVSKAPPLSLLQIMSPGSVWRAMETGIMRKQAEALSPEQRLQVAEFLTGRPVSVRRG